MARKNTVQYQSSNTKMENIYHLIRRSLNKDFSNLPRVIEKDYVAGTLMSPPFNWARTLPQQLCFFTGRPRAIYWDFGLSLPTHREMCMPCLLPGATRSSW
uniref:Ribosomal protein S14 n=1 Tax=Vicia sativa subsp. nigra TaxID=3909 RepID=A0A2H4N018_VICSN|nr:ribosomal protein S14 [Vicia sativa subsp. nigra]